MPGATPLDPRARGLDLATIPTLAAMLAERRWCTWVQKIVPRRDGTAAWTKRPTLPRTGYGARVNNTRGCVTWTEAAAGVGVAGAVGVGWFCVDDLTRAFLDIDKCRDPVTGEVAPWALAVLEMCQGAYVEVTPSGTGLRVLGACGFDVAFQGKLLMPAFLAAQDDEGLAVWGGSRECDPRAAIEIYFACARYVTVTGWDWRGDATVDIGGVAFELWLLADKQKMSRERDRDARIRRAGPVRTAEAGDIASALGVMSNEDLHWDDWSRVGMAAHAASGGDPDAFEAWRKWSEKCDWKHDDEACRERWAHWFDSPADALGWGTLWYLARQTDRRWVTPSRARCDEFDVVVEAEEGSARGLLPREAAETKPGEADARETAGAAFRKLAARMIYCLTQHRWLDTETFLLMDELRLRMEAQHMGVGGATVGGRKSLIARLARADSGMRKAHSLTMRPGAGALVDEGGQVHANVWRPSRLVPLRGATAADVKPWLDHAERLIPEESDRRRVIDRLAWALQNPGRKINSALVLQGGQGTGKDTLLVPFWAAIGEHNHTVVQGAVLGGSFNSYLERAWLLVAEMPSARRRDVYEDVKGWLTTPPDRFRINRKGLEEYDIPNIINVFITTNNEDAIAMAEDDRRLDVVAVVMGAGGAEEADARAGVLHDWYAHGGKEAVMGFLLSRDVSRFNPNARPPMTAAKALMARKGAHPAVAWVMGLWDDGRPMRPRNFVTVAELTDKGQAGKWQAGDMVARGMSREHVVKALKMLKWVTLPQQIVDGDDRPRVWTRAGNAALAGQLTTRALKDQLVADRGKSNIPEFD
jgi:hypothetical protein